MGRLLLHHAPASAHAFLVVSDAAISIVRLSVVYDALEATIIVDAIWPSSSESPSTAGPLSDANPLVAGGALPHPAQRRRREPTPTRGSRRRARPGLVGVGRDPFEERGLALADANAHRREAVTAAAATELVEERHDEARAGHPSGWPIAMAPPLTLTAAGSRPSSRITATDCDANASFSSTRSSSSRPTPARSSSLWTAGIGRRPSRAGRRPRLAEPRNVPSGSIHRPRALGAQDDQCGGAVVDPARVPGGHGALAAERGLQGREFLDARVGSRVLVALELPPGTSSSAKRPSASAAAQRRCDSSAKAS